MYTYPRKTPLAAGQSCDRARMASRLIKRGLGKELTLGFGGDFSLGGCIDQCLPHSVDEPTAREAARKLKQQHPLLRRGMRPSEIWGDAIGVLQADVSAISLTTPITLKACNQSLLRSSSGRRRAQRGHPLNLEVLLDANIDYAALANQTILDFREQGLRDTWEALEAAGVEHSGTGEDRDLALRPAVIDSQGRRVAIFSISAAGSGMKDAAGNDIWAAGERRMGISHFNLWDEYTHEATLESFRTQVLALRASMRISVIVFSVCWGQTNADGRPFTSGETPQLMRSFARGLVDVAGAHVVHGHGVGHLMGVEVYNGSAILYSCGTLLADSDAGAGPNRRDVSCFFKVRAAGTGGRGEGGRVNHA